MAFLEDIKKGLTDVSETIAKKSSEIVEVQKLKLKKSSLERDIRDAYVELGQLYFKSMEESGTIDEDAQDAFEHIVEANEALAEIKVKLDQASKGQVCPICGEKSAKGTAFCPHCGTKFEEEVEEEATEEVEEEVVEAEEIDVEVEDIVEEVTEDIAEEAAEDAEEVEE